MICLHLTVEPDPRGNAEIMGKKIQCIGRYLMDGLTLGKGNFAKVELATHGVTGCKVSHPHCDVINIDVVTSLTLLLLI